MKNFPTTRPPYRTLLNVRSDEAEDRKDAMPTPAPCPTDITAIWTGGPLPALGNPFTVDGRRAILVATRARTVLGTPIMYREVCP